MATTTTTSQIRSSRTVRSTSSVLPAPIAFIVAIAGMIGTYIAGTQATWHRNLLLSGWTYLGIGFFALILIVVFGLLWVHTKNDHHWWVVDAAIVLTLIAAITIGVLIAVGGVVWSALLIGLLLYGFMGVIATILSIRN